MRVGGLIAVLLLLSACVGEKLALAPSPGVDFSGQWRLNDADSDDPQRVAMSQSAAQSSSQNSSSGGQRGGRGPGRSQGPRIAGPTGPAVPAVGALSDGLHWPGKEVEIKQRSGVVTLVSGGFTQVYEPARSHTPPARINAADPRGDGPPPVCGWDDKTLVIKTDAPSDEDPPFEQRYSLSDDGRRLIEVVAFKGGRSSGFTVSRVWDKVQ